VALGITGTSREVDYYSDGDFGIGRITTGRNPFCKFLKLCPHISTLDDHDYAPMILAKVYILKEASRKIFMNYFCILLMAKMDKVFTP